MKLDLSDGTKRYTVEANHPTFKSLNYYNQSVFDIISVLNELEPFGYLVEIKEMEA